MKLNENGMTFKKQESDKIERGVKGAQEYSLLLKLQHMEYKMHVIFIHIIQRREREVDGANIHGCYRGRDVHTL